MIALLAMMAAISASMRLLPFVFSKWLSRWSLLEKLGATITLPISILLVAHLLEETSFASYPFGIPEVAGLAVVTLTQVSFRNVLISMGAGLITHQLLLHYL